MVYMESIVRVVGKPKLPGNSWSGSWANDHLDSHVIQKLAIRAGKAMQLYSDHQIGRPRFKSYKRGFHSFEAKTLVSCIKSKVTL